VFAEKEVTPFQMAVPFLVVYSLKAMSDTPFEWSTPCCFLLSVPFLDSLQCFDKRSIQACTDTLPNLLMKPHLQAVGGSPSASPPFPTARIAGTRSRSPSPVFRETPLSRTMTQSPDSFLSDLPLSSVPSRPLSPTSPLALDIGANYGETNTVYDQLGVVSPMGEIAIDENDIIIACVSISVYMFILILIHPISVMGPTGAGKSTVSVINILSTICY